MPMSKYESNELYYKIEPKKKKKKKFNPVAIKKIDGKIISLTSMSNSYDFLFNPIIVKDQQIHLIGYLCLLSLLIKQCLA